MRDNSVTIAKGITIMLMVMGHAGCPSWLKDYCYMFHMPLFLFMSGYCFKTIYLDEPKTFFKRKIQGIYKPYVKWTLFFLLFHNVFFYFNIYNTEFGVNGRALPPTPYTLYDLPKRFYHIFIGLNGNEPLTGPFWFLKSLFWGSLIFYVTRRIFKNIFFGILSLLLITFTELSQVNIHSSHD